MPKSKSNLTEADVLRLIRKHVESLFPKTCSNCQRVYANYREYALNTQPLAQPVSYHAELGDWKPTEAAGNLSLANCSCGTTLAIGSETMPLDQLWPVLLWVKTETERRGISQQDLLGKLRDELRRQVLKD